MVAGIAARTTGKIFWCLTRPDLFFPAISQAGLHPDRVIFCEGDKEEDVLASMEEGLSFGGFWSRGRRTGPAADDRVAPPPSGGREDRDDGSGRETMASAGGSFRLWPANGINFAVAHQRVAIRATARGRCGKGAMAGRINAGEGRRVC